MSENFIEHYIEVCPLDLWCISKPVSLFEGYVVELTSSNRVSFYWVIHNMYILKTCRVIKQIKPCGIILLIVQFNQRTTRYSKKKKLYGMPVLWNLTLWCDLRRAFLVQVGLHGFGCFTKNCGNLYGSMWLIIQVAASMMHTIVDNMYGLICKKWHTQ